MIKKRRTLIDLTSNIGYNDIAYGIKQPAQKELLGLMDLAGPRHQDADTS